MDKVTSSAELKTSQKLENAFLQSLNPILPGEGGGSAPPLRFFTHNSERKKDNSTRFGDFS